MDFRNIEGVESWKNIPIMNGPSSYYNHHELYISGGPGSIPLNCYSGSGSVLMSIDSIIDRTKKTSACADMLKKMLKGRLKH